MNTEENNNNNFSNGSSSFWDKMVSFWHNNRDFGQPEPGWINKADLINGTVPASQLPSYVDDVVESDTYQNLPASGEKGKIYIVTSDNTQYRWSGSSYIQINSTEFQLTTNNEQEVTGRKSFLTSGGNRYINNSLWIKGKNESNPAMTFFKEGVSADQLMHDGNSFHFKNREGTDQSSLVAKNITATGSFSGSSMYSSHLNGMQVWNAGSFDQLYIGNPNVSNIIIESGNNNLFHYRTGHGMGRIWDEHNLPQASVENWNNKFKNLKFTQDLDSVSEAGIYRQENPSSELNFTTTLNLNSEDGRQQLTIARFGENMKFRGINSGSGNTGWSNWKTVWHSENFNPADYQPKGNYQPAGDYILFNTDISTFSDRMFHTSFSSYTPEGLFSASATPLKTTTPGGKNIILGYRDYGSGQYYPRIGFTSETKWSLGPIGDYFTIGINNDGNEVFKITNSSALINDSEIWHAGNFNPESFADASKSIDLQFIGNPIDLHDFTEGKYQFNILVNASADIDLSNFKREDSITVRNPHPFSPGIQINGSGNYIGLKEYSTTMFYMSKGGRIVMTTMGHTEFIN